MTGRFRTQGTLLTPVRRLYLPRGLRSGNVRTDSLYTVIPEPLDVIPSRGTLVVWNEPRTRHRRDVQGMDPPDGGRTLPRVSHPYPSWDRSGEFTRGPDIHRLRDLVSDRKEDVCLVHRPSSGAVYRTRRAEGDHGPPDLRLFRTPRGRRHDPTPLSAPG